MGFEPKAMIGDYITHLITPFHIAVLIESPHSAFLSLMSGEA
jgi:hypothetical protein